jgi:hypothetical protein
MLPPNIVRECVIAEMNNLLVERFPGYRSRYVQDAYALRQQMPPHPPGPQLCGTAFIVDDTLPLDQLRDSVRLVIVWALDILVASNRSVVADVWISSNQHGMEFPAGEQEENVLYRICMWSAPNV